MVTVGRPELGSGSGAWDGDEMGGSFSYDRAKAHGMRIRLIWQPRGRTGPGKGNVFYGIVSNCKHSSLQTGKTTLSLAQNKQPSVG